MRTVSESWLIPTAHEDTRSSSPPSQYRTHEVLRRCKVLVLAAEPILRLGTIRALEGACAGVSAATNPTEAQQILAMDEHPLAVIVLDSTPQALQQRFATECADLIAQHASMAALVVLRRHDASLVRLAYQSGARGVLDSLAEPDQLKHVLARIHAGERVLQPSLAAYLQDDAA